MTLVELNKIEQILKENKESKRKARVLFNDSMREKYCDDDGCWFRDKMNATEKEIYNKLISEHDESVDAYKSFIEHDWR